MNAEDFKRKLTAILSADVQGYSRLMGDNEPETVRTLTAYREAITNLIQEYNGRVVDSPGDNILAEFISVVQAVECAVEIQKNLKAWNEDLPDKRRMEFRIGINLGDVIEEGERIYGDGVNIAARLEGLADGGGICISGTVHDQIENKLNLGYEDMGEYSVKNISKPIRVYKIPVQFECGTDGEDFSSNSLFDLSITDKPSIAVLPFTNMSGDPEQEYFSDGITEDIITALSKIPNMFVIARNSTFTFKGKPIFIQEVSKKLGVRYVLEGSVRKSGNRLRITAQLIDGTTGNHLWAERYDRDLEDIFALQDEITMKILTELQISLSGHSASRIAARGTNNIEAYLKFWQAQKYLESTNKNDNVLTRKMCDEIIKLDPNWCLGYAMLAHTHINDVRYGWSTSSEQSMNEAENLAKKVYAIDSTHPGYHIVMINLYGQKRQFEEAIAECEKVIEMEPNFSYGYSSLAAILPYAGRPEEAIPYCYKAIRLNPFYSGNFNYLGFSYFYTNQYESAIDAFKESVKLIPFSTLPHIYLAAIYSLMGKNQKALEEINEALKIDPNFSLQDLNLFPQPTESDQNRFVEALRKAGLK